MVLRGREDDPLGGNSLSGSVTGSQQQTDPFGSLELATQGNVRGVYALQPAMTPKYHTGRSVAGQNDKSLEKMARMFITFPPEPSALREAFINSVGEPAKRFARAMATTGDVQSGGLGYIDFFMTQAQEPLVENAQIVEVLGDNYVSYFYGQKPPIFRYDGVLLNSVQDDWRIAMWLIYTYIIRGTQLARRKVAVTLAYDSVMITGSIMNMTEILRADNELAVPFSFNMLVQRMDVVKLPLYGPTPVQTFPYKLTPDTFASTVVEPAKMSRRAVQEPTLTTTQRPGASDAPEASPFTVEVADSDVYNSVSAEEREAASDTDVTNGVFGSAGTALIDQVADDLNSPAS